jgi:hypothetical protein
VSDVRWWRASLRVGALVFASLVMGSAICSASVVFAQDAGVAEGLTGRETEFVAMTGPARESVPGGALLVAAYATIWVLLLGYVGRLALLQSSTSKDLARLDAALRARGDGELGVPGKASKAGKATKSEADATTAKTGPTP